MLCSQIYIVCALAVNAATGGNYRFLSKHPPVRSMLDLFSDPQSSRRWLYVLELDLTGLQVSDCDAAVLPDLDPVTTGPGGNAAVGFARHETDVQYGR